MKTFLALSVLTFSLTSFACPQVPMTKWNCVDGDQAYENEFGLSGSTLSVVWEDQTTEISLPYEINEDGYFNSIACDQDKVVTTTRISNLETVSTTVYSDGKVITTGEAMIFDCDEDSCDVSIAQINETCTPR